MLHQIRKMVGLVVAICRGTLSETVFQRCFDRATRVHIPIAPGEGGEKRGSTVVVWSAGRELASKPETLSENIFQRCFDRATRVHIPIAPGEVGRYNKEPGGRREQREEKRKRNELRQRTVCMPLSLF